MLLRVALTPGINIATHLLAQALCETRAELPELLVVITLAVRVRDPPEKEERTAMRLGVRNVVICALLRV